jgi:hypothetical protein
MINIKDIDRDELLHRLWLNQKTSAFFIHMQAPTYNAEEAKASIRADGYIDHACGRAIKTNLSEDEVNPRLYDRDAGAGTFQRVVDELRAEK